MKHNFIKKISLTFILFLTVCGISKTHASGYFPTSDTTEKDVPYPCAVPRNLHWEYVYLSSWEWGAFIGWCLPINVPGEPFFEGFENGEIPATWTNIDADGDSYKWNVNDQFEAHSGEYSAHSISYSLSPDNWLIMPQVLLGGSTLSFWLRQYNNFGSSRERYEVYVSTTGTDIADFDLVSQGTLITNQWERHTVDLTDFVGPAYIAFRHIGSYYQYNHWLLLDDVELTVAAKSSATTNNLQSFNVYRKTIGSTSYEIIANIPVVEGQMKYEYFESFLEFNTPYYYQVTALYAYEDGAECESEPGLIYNGYDNYLIIVIYGLEENTIQANVYPNPANSTVTIEADNINRITVVNTLGQVVHNSEVGDTNAERLDVSQFEAGVYVLRIVTRNGVATKRISVVR